MIKRAFKASLLSILTWVFMITLFFNDSGDFFIFLFTLQNYILGTLFYCHDCYIIHTIGHFLHFFVIYYVLLTLKDTWKSKHPK